MRDNTEQLTTYGNELVAAGFEVWLHRFGEGYLTYRDPATGNGGSLQYSQSGFDWQHLMPLVPSREYGSCMHMQDPLPVWTVEAARQCASASNYNDAVGTTLRNAGDRAWRSPSGVALHSPATR